jgi:hypothetical protein
VLADLRVYPRGGGDDQNLFERHFLFPPCPGLGVVDCWIAFDCQAIDLLVFCL